MNKAIIWKKGIKNSYAASPIVINSPLYIGNAHFVVEKSCLPIASLDYLTPLGNGKSSPPIVDDKAVERIIPVDDYGLCVLDDDCGSITCQPIVYQVGKNKPVEAIRYNVNGENYYFNPAFINFVKAHELHLAVRTGVSPNSSALIVDRAHFDSGLHYLVRGAVCPLRVTTVEDNIINDCVAV